MDRKLLKIHETENVGSVHIADDVIAIVAGMAALEIDGVYATAGKLTGDIVELFGKKNLGKGVQVTIGEDSVTIEIQIVVNYGVSALETTTKVQERVKSAIETMTGLEVSSVNVKISDVHVE